MQITHVEVMPVEFHLRLPYHTADGTRIDRTAAVFLRVETRQGQTAWGCTAIDPGVMGQTLQEVTRACRACADRALDLNPLNIEYALAELSQVAGTVRPALCAFDMAFHDLLALAARLPLYGCRTYPSALIRIACSAGIGSASRHGCTHPPRSPSTGPRWMRR